MSLLTLYLYLSISLSLSISSLTYVSARHQDCGSAASCSQYVNTECVFSLPVVSVLCPQSPFRHVGALAVLLEVCYREAL